MTFAPMAGRPSRVKAPNQMNSLLDAKHKSSHGMGVNKLLVAKRF